MSFFAPCPLTGGLSVPRKSGHRCNADLTVIHHGGWCPDLSGPAGVLCRGHETKKDIPILFYTASFSGGHFGLRLFSGVKRAVSPWIAPGRIEVYSSVFFSFQ